MLEATLKLINPLGLHARAAAKLVDTSKRFGAAIEIEKDERRVDAKSIMGLLTLGASCGTALKVRCDGEDEAAALQAIEALVVEGFHEIAE